jgi:hypothetical protein
MQGLRKILLLVACCSMFGYGYAQTILSSDTNNKTTAVKPIHIIAKPPLVKRPKPIHTELSAGIRLTQMAGAFL